MLNPIIYSFTVKEFKRTTIRMVVPLWRTLNRCMPRLIPAPSEHITSKFSRSNARAGRSKGRSFRDWRKRYPRAAASLQTWDARNERSTLTVQQAVMTPTLDISKSAGSQEQVPVHTLILSTVSCHIQKKISHCDVPRKTPSCHVLRTFITELYM